MRMKILDMVSSNVPFITTSKGLEGIHFNQGVDCLIADTTVDFADSMIKLSNNLDLQRTLVHQANEKMKNMYNPQEMLERRLSVYTSILRDEI
nr:CAZy families GT4 protein [uncultured Bacteroides sp.]